MTCPGPQVVPHHGSALVSSSLDCWVESVSPLLEGPGEARGCPGRSHRNDQSSGNGALCEARLKELELFRLEKARESLKNPAPERNSANPMSALTSLPSAAFLRRGDREPCCLLLESVPLRCSGLCLSELCVVLFHCNRGPGMALPSDEARRKSDVRCLSSWWWWD